MTRYTWRTGALWLTSALSLATVHQLGAQTAPATANQDDQEQPIVLSPFVVEASEDQGYQAGATLAGTRIRTDLKDVGSSISVVTQKFLQDTNSKNMEDLLVYTTGTEVAGQGGNFLGQGDGMVLTAQNVNRPVANTRVRGLATADNTRDFYLTDIPWDGYVVGRVDLQRGPNAILFGIGSPAGIVNSSLNHAALKNSYKLENQVGSFGSYRFTADLNQQLIKNELAIRLALLDDQTKYRQDPAYKDDKRVFGALRWDPAFLNKGSTHTTLEANFEKGRQLRLDPMETPPLDAITPWFSWYSSAQRAAGFSAADPTRYSSSADVNDPLVRQYGMYLGDYNGSRGGIPLSRSDPWLGAAGGRVFDGVVTAYSGGSPGYLFPAQIKPWPNTGAGSPTGAYANVLGYNGYIGITTYAAGVGGFANNAGLVGTSIGAFKAKSLTDRSIFDFYNNLIYGPNAQQFNHFKAYNFTARQTYWNDKAGIEVGYDKQHARFGNYTLVSNDATSVSIDVMKTLIDGSPNPNFGRPVVYAGGGSAGGNWDVRDREVWRATAFGDIDFKDLAGKDSFVTKIFGRNTLTGLYQRQKTDDWQANYNRYYIADSFVPEAAQAAVGQAARDDIFAIYLGSPLTGSTASGAGLTGIKTMIQPPGTQTINYWNNSTNAWQQISMDLVNNDQASDRQKTYRTSRKTKDIVTSTAGVWQGYWFDGALIPMFGYRTDKDEFWDAGGAPAAPANAFGKAGLVDIYDPSWKLPDTPSASIIVHSKTYSLVTHIPQKWREKLPGRLDVSLIYDKSENFQPDASRRDIMGHQVANPAGETKEYGVAISLLDDRLYFKWVHYKTTVTNATLDSNGISAQYLIGAVEAWGQHAAYTFRQSLAPGGPLNWPASTLFGYTSDGHQVTWQPDGNLAAQTGDPLHPYAYTQAQLDATYAKEKASVDAWFAQQVPADFQTAWALTDYATGGGSTNFGASGLVVTGDTISKGNEFELVASPMKGLNVSVNASKTSATRVNLAKSYVDWITMRWNQFLTTPSGDMRLWGAQNDGSYPDLNGAVGQGGETARGKFARETMAGYNLFQALQGADVPELRPWRFNVVANYDLQRGGWLKGVNIGGSYRWQQRNVTGFPIIGAGTATDPYKFDVDHPYKGSDEGILDGWIGYQRKLPWHGVKWRVQLNVRNILATDHLIRVTVQPNNEPGAYRIPEPRTFTLTNTFEF
jgi:hypothetical protein